MVGTLFNNLGRKLRMESRQVRDLRSYDPRARQTRMSGPTVVQIQTIDRCNATCLMCPYSLVTKTGPANSMDDGLYRRILEQIRRTGTVKSFLLMLQNEPLLDRGFPDRVRVARESLGRSVHIGTVTNGAPLTPSRIDALAASGIDHVSVSIDAASEETYRRIRHGLDFRRVVENTVKLAERLGPQRVRVKFLRQRENEGEEKAFLRFWRRHGVRATFSEPSNRAGTLEFYENLRKRRPDFWKRLVYPILNRLTPACPLPFSTLCILWDGRAITCCNDWEPRDTVGDLSSQTLSEVWRGEKINHHRHLLWTHRPNESSVCADCSLSESFWRI